VPDSFTDRLKHAWNIFLNKDPNKEFLGNLGPVYSTRPDRIRFDVGNERSIISSIYTRIGIDVSSVSMQHVRVDENNRYSETIRSGLNNCLSVEANVDQSSKAFIQDIVWSLCDEGVIAVVPIDTTLDPTVSGSYDIQTMRTGRIVEWRPNHVRVNLYNDRTGNREDVLLPKNMVAIIENPFYPVMNEPNSTLKRLIYKLNLLDAIDTQSGSGKLDLIIQLPYVIKTPARKEQAEIRRKDIEAQLSGTKYGIAYTDGTERITQLNRPAENNLLKQIEYLTSMLYGQLGLTTSIFDGTADEKVMLNYYNRTIEPFLAAISDGLQRKFITKTARSQGQTITYFRDVFKLVPAETLATVSDSFTRNAILSSNEVRSIIGYKPSNDPSADELRNKNLNPSKEVPTEEKVQPNQNERTIEKV